MNYTTKELCKLFQKTRQDLAYHAKKIGVKKFGSNYVWTDENVQDLKKVLKVEVEK
jgi:hypothetical protein